VHAHFAPTPPTVDYVGYGAALPAFSASALRDALRGAANLTQGERKRLVDGQRAFLTDHAGPCDGRATERVHAFVRSVLQAC